MGVYIKSMMMPKSCDYCRFCFEEDVMFETEWKCDLTGKYINGDYEGNFPDDCPLVALPEKHGRLIDADEITTDNIVHKMMIFGGQVCYSKSDIDNAPTVIEAEGEE